MIRRITVLAAIFTLFTLSLSVPAMAAEPDGGIIKGQLVNKTEGGSSVANQEITLKVYRNDAEIDGVTTQTDSQGYFVFNSLSTQPDHSYQVMLTFQQAEYQSGWLSFAEGETIDPVEIAVYDSTTSDEAIKVAMAHTVIYVGADSLKVMEYFLFANEADRAYIGSAVSTQPEERDTLRFRLPPEVTEFQPVLGLMECCLRGSEEGFTNTMPIFPGNTEVAYSYRVGHNSGTYTYARNADYPTARYDFLFQGENIEVTHGQLEAEEPMDIEGSRFKHLSGSNFAAGDSLEVQLASLPNTSNQGAIWWVVSTLVLLGIASGLVYLMRKRRLQPVSSADSPEQRKQRLLLELARLDDQFEAGEIPESSYRQLRSLKKTQVIELIAKAKEESYGR